MSRPSCDDEDDVQVGIPLGPWPSALGPRRRPFFSGCEPPQQHQPQQQRQQQQEQPNPIVDVLTVVAVVAVAAVAAVVEPSTANQQHSTKPVGRKLSLTC